MSAVRGRVRAGRVELDSELPEGADVVVLTARPDERFDLADDEVAELERRVADADRGDLVAADDVIRTLRSAR